jgi:hypothetical protein
VRIGRESAASTVGLFLFSDLWDLGITGITTNIAEMPRFSASDPRDPKDQIFPKQSR